MYWNILDNKRQALLPLLGQLAHSGEYYLAGGTGLALQRGHRDSIDFDFFRKVTINTEKLFRECEELFLAHGSAVVKIQEDKDTLGILVNGRVKISFMTYPYSMIADIIHTEHFDIASELDIACMKFSAITSRSLEKDYIDLYYVLQTYSLSTLLDNAKNKFPTIDISVILKSLVYFDDIIQEPILFKEGFEVGIDSIEEFIKNKVIEYSKTKLGGIV